MFRITVIHIQKKLNMMFGVVLISALMATVSTAPAVPAQVGCAEGEPKMGTCS